MKFVFFDVDETLLHLNGSAQTAIKAALEEVYGTAGPIDGFPMAGKTDLGIFVELLTAAGLPDPLIRERMDLMCTTYCRIYPETAASAGLSPCEGAVELLRHLESLVTEGALKVGLLTGNLECLPFAKLAAVGIDTAIFELGAYGSESEDRKMLARLAQERASALMGAFVPARDIAVIGDTPGDIACAQSIGARAIAIASGVHDADTLNAHAPDYVFPDLQDTAALTAVIMGDGR
jgi:phosphoglycolate phosphatase